VNGLTNAARRLQQVGESLERLNDVISEGATLDSLNTAVEALRAGLGNLEDGRRPDRVTRQQADETNDGMADRQENEVMERLEVLVRILSHFMETLKKVWFRRTKC
jgi:E3 ubiquitin-protein ligase makorin